MGMVNCRCLMYLSGYFTLRQMLGDDDILVLLDPAIRGSYTHHQHPRLGSHLSHVHSADGARPRVAQLRRGHPMYG